MEYELFFDLNLAGVTAALLKKEGKMSEVIAISEEKIDLPEHLLLSDIYRKSKPAIIRLAETFSKILREKKIGAGNIKAVFFLPFPYYLNQLQTVKIERKKQFSANELFLNAILDEETSAFRKKIKTEKNAKEDEIKILEREIIFSFLNGYPVKNLNGKQCLSMELHIFLSAAPKKIISGIEEELFRHLGNIKILFKTRLSASLRSARTLFGGEESFILLNVSDETSDILVLKDGSLRESVSFAKGEKFFSRRVAFAFNQPEKEGGALLSAFNKGGLAKDASEKIGKILDAAFAEWKEALKKAFLAVLAENLLPAFLKVNAPKAIQKGIAEILSSQELKSYTVLGRPFKTDFLDEELLLRRIKIDPALKPRIVENLNLALLIYSGLE